MKAAVLEQIEKLLVKDVAKPGIRQNEILVKVDTCGICGTDIKLYKGKYTANMPVVLGHEYAGEVVEIGKDVKRIRVGDRIVPDPNESCGVCYWCRSGKPCFCSDLAAYGVLRDGGFAEYAKLTEKGAHKIPDELDYETASFTEPVSCAVHCIDRAAIQPGETVLIIGGGSTGQILLQLARDCGASRLIMVTRSEWKLRLAESFGAADVINADKENVLEKTLDITDGLGADVIIEAVGTARTIEQAVTLAKKTGRIIIFGFAPEGVEARIMPFDIISKELTIMGSWVNPYTFPRALMVLANKKIDVETLISTRLPLDDIVKGFKLMMEKPEGFMKALVKI
ncbi:MAG: zinc-dependent alcohol dehydrogenase family protein [Spirochaetales bacterium]|nr:zinc-dependent alcohol dehydrogenase family protein [Spirochaetales bacterium]